MYTQTQAHTHIQTHTEIHANAHTCPVQLRGTWTGPHWPRKSSGQVGSWDVKGLGTDPGPNPRPRPSRPGRRCGPRGTLAAGQNPLRTPGDVVRGARTCLELSSERCLWADALEVTATTPSSRGPRGSVHPALQGGEDAEPTSSLARGSAPTGGAALGLALQVVCSLHYTGSAAASSAPNCRQVLDPQAPRLSRPDQGSWRSPHPKALPRAVPPWGLGRGHTHASISVLLSWAAGPVWPGDKMLADLRGQSPRAQTHTGTQGPPHTPH